MLKKLGFILMLLAGLLYIRPNSVFSINSTHLTQLVENDCQDCHDQERPNPCHTQTECVCFSVINSFQSIFVQPDYSAPSSHSFEDFLGTQFIHYTEPLLKGIKDDIFQPPIVSFIF